MLPFCCCYCLLVFSVLLFPPNLFTSISLIDVCELCFVFLFFNFNDLLFWSTPAPLPHCPPPSSSSSSLLFSQHLPSFIKRHTPLKQQLTTTITTASKCVPLHIIPKHSGWNDVEWIARGPNETTRRKEPATGGKADEAHHIELVAAHFLASGSNS